MPYFCLFIELATPLGVVGCSRLGNEFNGLPMLQSTGFAKWPSASLAGKSTNQFHQGVAAWLDGFTKVIFSV
jgi:hypothetical protein